MHIRGIDVHVLTEGNETLPTIIFLHGFSGSVQTWREVTNYLKGEFQVICIDLIGHGKSSVPVDFKRYQMVEQLKDLEMIFKQLKLDNFTLVGYSMGGRVALAYASDYPARVKSLILESASPGLATEDERVARRKADELLADRIMREGITSFVDFWESIALFDSQKGLSEDRREKVRNERIGQCEQGLSNSLLGIGTGNQPSYWREIEELRMPVYLITGEYDKKFVGISQEMKKFIPNVYEVTVKSAGHAIHVEKPLLFATMIREYSNLHSAEDFN